MEVSQLYGVIVIMAIAGLIMTVKMVKLYHQLDSLKAEKALLELIFDSIDISVYAKDINGRFLYINREWERITNNDRNDIIGKTDFEFLSEAEAKRYWHLDTDVIENMKRLEVEEQLTVDDEAITILSIKVPMTRDDKTIGVCGIGMDITELKKLQSSLSMEKERSEQLLLNVLPKSVANDLMTYGKTKTQKFENIGVLFSDICDFTRISSGLPAEVLIEELNDIFSSFDHVMEKTHCERIKTIGDAYMAVCGMSTTQDHYADHIVEAAIKFNRVLKKRKDVSDIKWKIKVGIHAGPVVGGIVGVKKYIYDIFGTTVNMASRLQSATKIYDVDILISDSIYENIRDKSAFSIREIDIVRVKGEYHPIRLYEVFDCDDEELKEKKRKTLNQFNAARNLYIAGDFEAAMEAFRVCQELVPEDQILSIYMKRCNTMKRLPPSGEWQGISGI